MNGLGKRIFRDLKDNFLRWLALFMLIFMGMYIVVSVVGAAENIIVQSRKTAEKNSVESGEFKTFFPLAPKQEEFLRDLGIFLERKFSIDIKRKDGTVIRLMQNRGDINLVVLDKGRFAANNGEVVLEKRYCEENGFFVGDKIEIASIEFIIVGIGTAPDYDLPVKNLSDMSANSRQFGIAFVTLGQYNGVLEDGAKWNEDYTYAYQLNNGVTDEDVKRAVRNFGDENLILFLSADENPRILAAAGDMVMNRQVGLLAGAVVMVLFAYVISVFVIHQINRESGVIGTLYALGVKKKELLVHYMVLPTTVTFLGGLTGALMGFSKWGMEKQAAGTYSYFSIPFFRAEYPLYLVIYALVMPPLISVVVNFAVINKELSKTALELMRNGGKTLKYCNIKLPCKDFVHNFQLRQMLREGRAGITMMVGMFISLLIFMLGLNCLILCQHIESDGFKSLEFKYMYFLKYPKNPVPDGGEACYIEYLSKTEFGYKLDISVIGIYDSNKYFDCHPSGKNNGVVIGNSTATKYRLDRGDKIVLTDREKGIDYEFFVEDICGYSVGLTVFMDIVSMRELFLKEEGYYNMLLSDRELKLEESELITVTSRAEIEQSLTVFTELMMPMVIMVTIVSAVVFFVVIFLMLGVMIDRSVFGISLIKIFGFRQREIRRLYLNGNMILIALGAVVCIPLSKALMDAVYPVVVANVACGLNLRFEWYLYVVIFLGTIMVYFIANILLMRKIYRIPTSIVLRNRD